jgi:hypothetical protein
MLQTIYESESNFSTTTNKLVVHQRLLDQQKMHNVNSGDQTHHALSLLLKG